MRDKGFECVWSILTMHVPEIFVRELSQATRKVFYSMGWSSRKTEQAKASIDICGKHQEQCDIKWESGRSDDSNTYYMCTLGLGHKNVSLLFWPCFDLILTSVCQTFYNHLSYKKIDVNYWHRLSHGGY